MRWITRLRATYAFPGGVYVFVDGLLVVLRKRPILLPVDGLASPGRHDDLSIEVADQRHVLVLHQVLPESLHELGGFFATARQDRLAPSRHVLGPEGFRHGAAKVLQQLLHVLL